MSKNKEVSSQEVNEQINIRVRKYNKSEEDE